jgi:hypothetical protein
MNQFMLNDHTFQGLSPLRARAFGLSAALATPTLTLERLKRGDRFCLLVE